MSKPTCNKKLDDDPIYTICFASIDKASRNIAEGFLFIYGACAFYWLSTEEPFTKNWHEHEIITCWAIGFLSSILLLIGSIFKKPLLYVLWIVYTFFVFFFFPLVLSLIALVGLMTSDAKLPEYTINKDSVNGEGLLAVVVVCSIYFCGVFYLMYVVSRECYVLSIQEGKRHFPDSKENSSIEEEVKLYTV